MARKLEEIQDQILGVVASDGVLSEKLTSTSKVSIWRLIVFVISYAIMLHEQIVEENAQNSRPHTKRWYREQAMAFMDGHELTWRDGQFKYDTTGMTDGQISDAKPVTHVAITEAANGVLVVKTATASDTSTTPLAFDVHGRFVSYMGQIKDAGNRLEYINQAPDDLQLLLTVWVDDIMIAIDSGELVNNSGVKPVEVACKEYLNALEFNGAFVKTFLVDMIQKAEGVKIARVENLKHRVLANTYEDVEEYILPFAGHFNYANLNVIYRKFNEVA